jgi:hypothetical protein
MKRGRGRVYPERRLARELEVWYAVVSMVTDDARAHGPAPGNHRCDPAPMRRMLAYVALAAALATFVAGCGGSDGDQRLSKSDYETQIGSIDAGLFAALQAVGSARTVKATLAALERCQAEFGRLAGELEAIAPPKDVETEHEELTTGVREFPGQLDPIIARVANGNRLAIAGVQSMPAMTKMIRATAGINHKGYVLRTPG